MKTEKVITVASSSNRRVSPEFEQCQNEQLLSLYKQYKENPFDYAIIDYTASGESKVKIHSQKQRFSLPSVKQFFKKLFHSITKIK